MDQQDKIECASCGGIVETIHQTETFLYGKGTGAMELKITVPVRKCLDCGFQFIDYAAEEAHDEAVRRNVLAGGEGMRPGGEHGI